MKKIICILLTAALVFSFAACTKNENENEPDKTAEVTLNIPDDGSVVAVTLPAFMVTEGATQQSLEETLSDEYTAVKLNADGSATYVMTRENYETKLTELKESVDESIDEIIGSEDFTVTSITYNDDMTEFNVNVSGDKLGDFDYIIEMLFEMQAQIYQAFKGIDADEIAVHYYTPDGTELSTDGAAITEAAE